jgi:hypothetical protein
MPGALMTRRNVFAICDVFRLWPKSEAPDGSKHILMRQSEVDWQALGFTSEEHNVIRSLVMSMKTPHAASDMLDLA